MVDYWKGFANLKVIVMWTWCLQRLAMKRERVTLAGEMRGSCERDDQSWVTWEEAASQHTLAVSRVSGRVLIRNWKNVQIIQREWVAWLRGRYPGEPWLDSLHGWLVQGPSNIWIGLGTHRSVATSINLKILFSKYCLFTVPIYWENCGIQIL
jgi:hypothetical protein